MGIKILRSESIVLGPPEKSRRKGLSGFADIARLRRFVTVAALVALALPLPGCGLWRFEAMRSHVIDYPSPQKIAEAPIPETVMVYGLLLADSVDFRHLVITKRDGKEQSMTRQPWEENPAEMVTQLIQRDLEASGLFEKTVDQWSTARYRYALEGKLISLHGVINEGKAKAVIEAEVTLIDFDSPLGAKKTIIKKTYKIEVPSVDSNPASIARAINIGIRRLSERIRSDIRLALEKPNGSGSDKEKPVLPESAVRVSLNGAAHLQRS